MRLLGARGVDVALLPVWGWGPTLGPGHLDPQRAAEAVAPHPAADRRPGALGHARHGRHPAARPAGRAHAPAARGAAAALRRTPSRARGLDDRGSLVTEPGRPRRARQPCGDDVTAGAVLADGWTDPSSIGYPVIFLGVLLGSIVPVVPTGAVVGAGAALAVTSDRLSLPVVLAARRRRRRSSAT